MASRVAGRKESNGSGPLRVFLALALAFGFFVSRGPVWNADSHLFLTYALVDDHSLQIDRFAEHTGDRAAHAGHYYTDKAPGLSFLAALPYAGLRALGSPPTGPDDFFVRYLLSWLVVGLPTALAGALLYAAVRRTRPAAAPWAALAFGLGGLAWPYSTLLYSHQLVADLVVFALLVGRRPVAVVALGCLAFAIEPPAALLFAPMAGLALAGRRPTLGELGAAGVICAATLGLVGAYNAAAFGSPISSGYSHLAGPEEFQVGQAQGFFGFVAPSLDALWGMSLSPYRGILLLMPVLWAVPWALYRQRDRAQWLLAGVALGYFVLCSAYFMWWGGAALGPRHFVPALPLLLWPVLFTADRWAVRGLVLLSVAVTLFVTAPFPFVAQEIQNPWLDAWLPAWQSGALNNNLGLLLGLRGPASLLPLGVLVGGLWPWRTCRQEEGAVTAGPSCPRVEKTCDEYC